MLRLPPGRLLRCRRRESAAHGGRKGRPPWSLVFLFSFSIGLVLLFPLCITVRPGGDRCASPSQFGHCCQQPAPLKTPRLAVILVIFLCLISRSRVRLKRWHPGTVARLKDNPRSRIDRDRIQLGGSLGRLGWRGVLFSLFAPKLACRVVLCYFIDVCCNW